MNRESLRLIALSLMLVAVMPLRADGESCFAPTTSFASTVRNPTNGDEKFFTLPAGPANVMFILDSSGSMLTIPQCGDMVPAAGYHEWWGRWQPFPGMTACTWPASIDVDLSGNSAQTVGTCDVASNPELAWMGNVVLQTAYADPGHGAPNSLGLDDQPSWGTGCSGDDCLFDPDGYYITNQWTESSATRYEDCTAYTQFDSSGDPIAPQIVTGFGSAKVTAGDLDACRTCLATEGFYFFKTRYRNSAGNWVNTSPQIRLSGKWLNANPPKVVAARKVIKDLIWIDPSTPNNRDRVRFGLSKITNGGEILVPLGPDKGDSYVVPGPTPLVNFVEPRQLMLNVLNRNTSPAIALASGSTPLATTLFRVGQYFTSSGKYTEWFPSGSYELTDFEQGVAGTANASWARNNADQCSICWGCQQNSIILVTDGSPNSERSLPSELASYDDATYKRDSNCGPGDCSGAATCSDVIATNVNATRSTGAANVFGTVTATRPSVDCLGTSCRCRAGEPRINRNTNFCYTCPGSATLHNPTFTCTWYTCEGDATRYAANRACYGLCSGDTTHHPVGYNCGCFCGTDLVTSYPSGSTCPASMCCSPTDSSTLTLLPRVASWLHNHDLRSDTTVKDPQVVSTYTVSFGILEPPSPAVNPAVQILKATAAMGGGFFSNARDRSDLAAALAAAVAEVADQATSFGAPAAASLSTLRTVAVEAVLTRFLPNDSPMWEGHVFQGQLFDEFLNGCIPSRPRSEQPIVSCAAKSDLRADFNGDGKCTGVFLLDADCDEVEEDSTGVFYKKGVLSTSGTCSVTTTTACSTTATPTGCPSGETCVVRGGVLANMFWDAGLALSAPTYPTGHPKAGQAVPGYKAANDRNILSVIGTAVTPFDRAHAADWLPYLNLDTAWCTTKLQTWRVCGSAPLPDCSTFTGGVRQRCAQAIIDFVHGWDVTDSDGDRCGGPEAHDNATACTGGADGEERNRENDGRSDPSFWKLGDTFHSSPVLVRGPPDTFRCNTGLENQCTPTLYSPATFAQQTSMATGYTALDGSSTASAYEAFRLAQRSRQQVVLVGANDGMLHAFDAGSADTSATPDAFGVYPYGRGNGTELWAFIPPDLLPRLKDLTAAHQYMVDGGVMVKDVWVDGSTSDPADFNSSNPIDTVKQYEVGKEEFHTVAVITERTGGTQYTGLDITDVTSPKFLWSFPPPGSDDARYMAQSWSDFSPGPPPIGPFRFAPRTGVVDPTGRPFEERWAVAVNGGYDPTLARGRAVWLVDVWTGNVLWRFTDDDFKANMAYGSGASMLPVVGSVSGADIGDWNLSTPDNDGFYDTLTWADMGGSVFVARVWGPGTLDGSGKVTDWYAARTFEQQRQSGNTQPFASRTPFFYMPDLVFDSTSKTLRAFLGSGNRERIMATTSECNPDNLLGCCQAGCTAVTATVTDTFGTCTQSASFSCTSGVLSLPATTSTCATAPACGVGFSGVATVHLECPSQPAIDVTSSTSCTSNGTSYECTTPTGLGTSAAANLDTLTTKARFYGIWAFGGVTAKSFNTLEESRAFEANRFTDRTYSGCTGPAGGACGLVDVTSATVTYDATSPSITSASVQATSADAGWYYQYGTNCPLASCEETAWVDEKTGAGASVMVGCVSWGGFRPTTASGGGDDPCTDRPLPQAFSYLADYVSGTPSATCGYQNVAGRTYLRATQRSTFATPAVQTVRVVLSPTGEVKYQGLEFPPGGTGGAVSETTYGTRSDVAETMYWLEVPRDLHNCRHVAALAASVCE